MGYFYYFFLFTNNRKSLASYRFIFLILDFLYRSPESISISFNSTSSDRSMLFCYFSTIYYLLVLFGELLFERNYDIFYWSNYYYYYYYYYYDYDYRYEAEYLYDTGSDRSPGESIYSILLVIIVLFGGIYLAYIIFISNCFWVNDSTTKIINVNLFNLQK